MGTIKRSTRKSGHSIITTLPPDVLTKLNIQVGDKVEFILSNDRVELRKAAEENSSQSVSTDFLAMVEESMAEYDEALRNLVER
nr:AbrB/MazE/SpoVT family DNA-binding domain-containing protein [uncultured Trichococcus sp.]